MGIKGMEVGGEERAVAHQVAVYLSDNIPQAHPHRPELLKVKLSFYRLANLGAFPVDVQKESVRTIRDYVEKHPDDAEHAVEAYVQQRKEVLDAIMAQEDPPQKKKRHAIKRGSPKAMAENGKGETTGWIPGS